MFPGEQSYLPDAVSYLAPDSAFSAIFVKDSGRSKENNKKHLFE